MLHGKNMPHRFRTAGLSLPIFLTFMLTLLAGCSSQRGAQKHNKTEAEVPADVSLQTPQQRFDALCRSYADWQDVSLPLSVSLRSPKSISFSARAVMKRGAWISMSVRMLGFEVASVYVDNDSVHAIDKFHKAYLSESIKGLFGNVDVTVADLQDLLLGRGFVIGRSGGTFTPESRQSLGLNASAEGLMILPATKIAGFQYGFIMPPGVNCVGAASLSLGEKYEAVVAYSDYIKTSHSGEFAGLAAIDMVKGQKLAATLDWNFSSAKWNTGADVKWKRPNGYSRMSAEKILKALTKL